MKNETQQLLEKAGRSIEAAELLAENDQADFSASRSYYAMFYVAEALLNEQGLHFSKHGNVHAAFGENFAKTGLFDAKYHHWLIDAFGTRQVGDYGLEADIGTEFALQLIRQAREFLEAAQRYLAKQNQ
jgi:uncharacterized protein (UPF0332 family)